jgi:hypothetical protein
MTPVEYRGRHTAVVLSGGVRCPRGVPVDVDDELARQLLDRPDFQQLDELPPPPPDLDDPSGAVDDHPTDVTLAGDGADDEE